MKCEGGFRESRRECTYPQIEVMKTWPEPYDNDYDNKQPCEGESIRTEGKDDGEDKCQAQPCVIGTLVLLMESATTFGITKQNWIFDFIHKVLEQLNKEDIEISSYRLPLENRVQNFDVFKNTLRNFFEKENYGEERYMDNGYGNGASGSMAAILDGLRFGARHGEVFFLFTDSGSHSLGLEQEIIRRKIEMDIQIFIFIVGDYNIYRRGAKPSFRAYQKITRGHTYITDTIEPASQVARVIKKNLKWRKVGKEQYYIQRKAKGILNSIITT